MADNSLQNEQKLLRNIDNIIKNYLKVDDSMIEALANEDESRFEEIAMMNSESQFLNFLDQYPRVSEELQSRIKELHQTRIDEFKQEKARKEQSEIVNKPKIITPARTKQKGNYAPKGTKQKWSKQEKKLIKRSIKSGDKLKKTTQRVNKYRQAQGLPLRSQKSVQQKYYKEKR